MGTMVVERGLVSSELDQARQRWIAANRAKYCEIVVATARGQAMSDDALLELDEFLERANLSKTEFQRDVAAVAALPHHRAELRACLAELGAQTQEEIDALGRRAKLALKQAEEDLRTARGRQAETQRLIQTVAHAQAALRVVAAKFPAAAEDPSEVSGVLPKPAAATKKGR